MILPTLPTLATKPSWVNRAGRVDRSACVELRASEIKRLLFSPVPGKRRDTRGPEGSVQYTVNGALLEQLHAARQPRGLRGDARTGKSNAIKSRFTISPHVARPDAPNPNKGASQQKVLALLEVDGQSWSQTLVLQRWRLHAKLAQHFLICPKCQQKTMKLFMPLCMPEEAADAAYVAIYLRSLRTYQRNAAGSPLEAQLLNRYAPLLPPRQLRCARCLGLRYGEVKYPSE